MVCCRCIKKYIKINKIVGEITRDREDINCKWLFVSNLMVYPIKKNQLILRLLLKSINNH